MPDTSDLNATRATRVQHKWDTSATRVLQKWHECEMNENFGFHNNTSKSIFLHPYIYYLASEKLKGEEQVYSKN